MSPHKITFKRNDTSDVWKLPTKWLKHRNYFMIGFYDDYKVWQFYNIWIFHSKANYRHWKVYIIINKIEHRSTIGHERDKHRVLSVLTKPHYLLFNSNKSSKNLKIAIGNKIEFQKWKLIILFEPKLTYIQTLNTAINF